MKWRGNWMPVVSVFVSVVLILWVGIKHARLESELTLLQNSLSMLLNHSENTDSRGKTLQLWDTSAKMELRIESKIKDDLEMEYGLEKQGKLIVRVSNELKKLQNDAQLHPMKIFQQNGPTEPPRRTPSCVNNPPLHYEYTGETIRECMVHYYGSNKADPHDGWPVIAYVLSLHGLTKRIQSLQTNLKSFGLELVMFEATNGHKKYSSEYTVEERPEGEPQITWTNPETGTKILRGDPGFLTAGERGYSNSMLRLFQQLQREPNPDNRTVMVIDDDALFDCDFPTKLRALLAEPRCGVPTHANAQYAGALLLGAAIWIDGTYPQRGAYVAGWRLTDAELKSVDSGHRSCHNVHSKTFGSFAVLYHPAFYQRAIDWITTSSSPFDHIYKHLVRKGVIVRIAYPAIVVQDVRRTSQIDPLRRGQHNFTFRANVHRWQPLDRFCDENMRPIRPSDL